MYCDECTDWHTSVACHGTDEQEPAPVRAESVIASNGQGLFETLQDALTVAATTVRAHATKLGGIDHLAMHAAEWEMLADALDEASLRPWLEDAVSHRGPDDQIWGARWIS